jgi:hypothetical protein
VDEHLELDIRKGYSEYYSEFEGLVIWIGGLLEQLSFHDPLVYSFDVRIRTIDSLLLKVIAWMDKESFACFHGKPPLLLKPDFKDPHKAPQPNPQTR